MSDVKITALGYAALKISSPGKTVYVDAFLAEHPMPSFDGSDADLIIVTHDDLKKALMERKLDDVAILGVISSHVTV